MPKTEMSVTSTSVDTTSPDNLPQSGWVEFSDGKCYHWSRAPYSEDKFLLSTRSRAYEGAPWKHRIFKSPRRLALLIKELDG